ncbi:MAG TPA: hypothetical protein VM243_11490 [Phycisphaerae bacterium]|nr:hypothetical protein [Phycisphaerae bacterium]
MKPGSSIWIGVAALAAALCWAFDAPAQETPPPAQQPPEEAQPTGQTEPEPPPTPVDDGDKPVQTPSQPSAEDIIRRFQEEQPAAVPVLPSGGDDEIITRAEPEDLANGPGHQPRLPDGYMLSDRTGRLGQEGGWWVFLFEADNESHPEPPMKLLPCQTLERMVRESRGGLDPVVFIITAEVTDFQSENYLLPRKVLRRRDLGNLQK